MRINIISIHAPRGGSDRPIGTRHTLLCHNFNPRSPWGERHSEIYKIKRSLFISIHAPRGGSDRHIYVVPRNLNGFQSTLPVGGATSEEHRRSTVNSDFNPRSPWGERRRPAAAASATEAISIHAPRGGSDLHRPCSSFAPSYFNPRSPWGERPRCSFKLPSWFLFQSTLPVGGATFDVQQRFRIVCISIHAPRGGSDEPEDFASPV